MIVIRPATLEDAVWLSSRLRSEDAQEIETATGRSPQEILPESFGMSQECFTVRRVFEGKLLPQPVALFGVAPSPLVPSHAGIVWFLGTDEVRLCALSIIREAPAWLDFMSRRFSEGLFNVADSRNTLHIRWCQLTGFTLMQAIPLNGVPFHPIHRPSCVTP
jgi:hypothetical protein